ncbi:hypothetical protein F7U66_01045 [Vibrio parahaemolyticus]|nr:hypothetical protein [Vibrio parahaemolyticus]
MSREKIPFDESVDVSEPIEDLGDKYEAVDPEYPEFEGSAPSRPVRSLVASFVNYALILYSVSVSSFALYQIYESQEDSVSSSQIAGMASLEDVNRLSMDVRILGDDLADLNIAERLDGLELQAGDALTRLSTVESLSAGLDGVLAKQRELKARLLESEVAVDSLDFVTPEELARVTKKIFMIESRVDDFVETAQVVSIETVDDAVQDHVKEPVVAAPTYEVRHRIGPLEVERFVQYTERFLLIMGDGVSGTVQLAEGNRIGRYVVEDVGADFALLLDTVLDERFELRER